MDSTEEEKLIESIPVIFACLFSTASENSPTRLVQFWQFLSSLSNTSLATSNRDDYYSFESDSSVLRQAVMTFW